MSFQEALQSAQVVYKLVAKIVGLSSTSNDPRR
jgi:hypothetical protein